MESRWLQRFENYQKALAQLLEAVSLHKTRELSQIETQGLIKAFEFTHELAWNVMKDFFKHKGATISIMGSRDATREAFQYGLIEDGNIWMDMIVSRNQTYHSYNHKVSQEISGKIIHSYVFQFEKFASKMKELENEKI